MIIHAARFVDEIALKMKQSKIQSTQYKLFGRVRKSVLRNFFLPILFRLFIFSVIFSLSEIFSVLYIFYFLVVPVTLVNEMCVENDFVSF